MPAWWSRLFGAEVKTPNVAETPASEHLAVAMHWRDDTRLPIPDWERVAETDLPEWEQDYRDAYWTSAARHWLRTMADALSPGYAIRESKNFLLLSPLEARKAELFLRFCQSALRRISESLEGVRREEGDWKQVVIVFSSEDEYYDYISHYHPEGGEYSMSSGVFINAGYGHFVTFEADLDAVEPVIAHELTHAMLSHLPIPLWLNEGMAVNTEHVFFPRLADPRASLYWPREIQDKHAAFWNADTIQEFWTGGSFQRTDDGSMLSYDLAKHITALAARDEPAFRAFLREAHWQDAGMSAASHLGYPLQHLIEAVLGEGSWQPTPDAWHSEIEHPPPRACG